MTRKYFGQIPVGIPRSLGFAMGDLDLALLLLAHGAARRRMYNRIIESLVDLDHALGRYM